MMNTQEILALVNETLKIDITNTARDASLVDGRLIYFHLCDANEIHKSEAAEFIGKHRTTVNHSLKMFKTVVNNDYDFRAKFQRVQHAMGIEGVEIPVNDTEVIKEIKTELDKANEYITLLEKRALQFQDIKHTLYTMAEPKDEEEINFFLRQIISKINIGISN